MEEQLIPEDVMEEWLAALDTPSEATKRSYRNGWRALERYVARNGLDIDSLEESDLIAFKEDCLKRLSPGTVSTYLTGIRSFYRWAGNPAFPDVASRIRGARTSREFKKDVLSAEQVRMVLDSLKGGTEKDARDYAMVNLMVHTGLRDIEVSRLCAGDIHEDSGVTVLNVHGKGRTGKDDFVVLEPEAYGPIMEYLEEWRPDCAPSDPLFASTANRNKGGSLTTRAISGVVKGAFRKCGLDSERLTAHSLRHTAVTMALLAGASIEETQAMARHADISTTMVYAHHIDRLRNSAERKIADYLRGDS